MLKPSTKRAITIILAVIVTFQIILIASLWHQQLAKNKNYSHQLDSLQSQITGK